jgi:hypothetical protein
MILVSAIEKIATVELFYLPPVPVDAVDGSELWAVQCRLITNK